MALNYSINDLAKNHEVFFARDYEEAKRIELSQEKVTINSVLLRLFIAAWVWSVNILLWFLQRVFFQSKRYFQNGIKNVAVYTVGTLGDNVLLLPAIASIKRQYPNVTVTVITNCDGFSDRPAREVLGGSLYVDGQIVLLDHPVQRQGFHFVVNAPGIQKENYDMFINLSPFGNRGWLGAVVREMLFAKWIGAKQAIGFKMSTYSRKNFFNKVQHHFVKNEAYRCRSILKELGLNTIENRDLLPVNQEAKNRVLNVLSKYTVVQAPLVVINPGAKLNASHWPADRFGTVAAWMAKTYNACVVLNGIESEKEICENVVRTSDELAINMAGKFSIQELIELLRMSSLCVTNNTGPMTLSAMVGIPTVVISSTRFSPTFYMPISERMIWLFSFHKNSYSYMDEGRPSEDLLNIQVRDVLNAVKEMIPRKIERVFSVNERISTV